MTPILVDSCVILDLITEDPNWFEWSSDMIKEYSDHPLVINPIIYAEISTGYQKIEEVETAVSSAIFKRIPLPWEAAFLAGKAFVKYPQLGGPRSSSLPDFFIGAHAAVENLFLLTRDAKRFRYYYPKLKILSP